MKKDENFEPDHSSNLETFYVKVGNILEPILIRDITRIQSDGNYCYIFSKDRKYVVKKSLVKLMDLLPEKQFVRIHMRFAVALHSIKKIDLFENTLYINELQLAIGPKFKTDLISKLNIM